MNIRSRIKIACVLVPIFLAGQAEGAGIAVYSAVEFQGLQYITKEEIAKSAGFRGVQGGVRVDIGMLEKALSGIRAVKSYSISSEGNRLLIRVVEKMPLIVCVFTKGKRTVLYELDSACSVISAGSVRAWDVPYVHIQGHENSGRCMTAGIGSFCRLMAQVRAGDPSFYTEISEVVLRGPEAEVMLKKRKTRFRVKPERSCLERLKYIAGYLDRIRFYPDSLDVTEDRVLIR